MRMVRRRAFLDGRWAHSEVRASKLDVACSMPCPWPAETHSHTALAKGMPNREHVRVRGRVLRRELLPRSRASDVCRL